FFLATGFLNVAQPEKMLRWTIRHRSDLTANKLVVALTRWIGLGLMFMGAATLAMVLQDH
ncbi:MAG: hypothetical protein ABI833_17350, partial [Acidobacteriota bacterium]